MAHTRPREGLAIMRAYSLSHLTDPELKRDLTSAIAQDRTSTACVLAHIAEFDVRRLYLSEAYPSMFDYCVHKLRLSEDAAYKRIRAARAARQFPVIFEAVADGRLHLSAVVLLTPYLTPESAYGLLAAAAHKTKAEIEELLARRFPRTEAMGLVVTLPAPSPRVDGQLAPGPVGHPNSETPQLSPAQVGTRSKLAPVAAERFLIEATVGRSAQEKLRYIQDLLGHELPSGDLAQVLEQAFDALIEKLEKRKFAATSRPRRIVRPSANPRHIPAQVKCAVWARDGGQCTFVSEAGRRCEERKLLEFDHVEEVARGGEASLGGIRLRCRAHNQYGAECTFGAAFMRAKREAAQCAAEARRKEAEARARAAAEEVIAPLRSLGFRTDEARSAAALCESIPDASLEERVRRALTYFHPPRTSLRSAPWGAGVEANSS
jgi:hypothetical protein